MSGAKEIRTKIKSVQNTKKITSAMQMVAASKMRKAQDHMSSVRPYADKIAQLVWRVSQANSDYKHPFTIEREAKKICIIVVTSDRGLCGGLNINVLRMVSREIEAWDKKGVDAEISVIGKKGIAFFKSYGGKVISSVESLGDKPPIDKVLGLINTVLERYKSGGVDRVFIANNKFVNNMTQTPVMNQIIPCQIDEPEEQLPDISWDYDYEPSAQPVIDITFERYIESQVYSAMVENIASEQSARMVAMKAASDNAGSLIDELNLVYNKARQAAITQEISEIVSGAEAV